MTMKTTLNISALLALCGLILGSCSQQHLEDKAEKTAIDPPCIFWADF